MPEEQKAPPSQFEGEAKGEDENVSAASEAPEWPRALLIQASDEGLRIVEKFEFDGVAYEPVPGLVEDLIPKLALTVFSDMVINRAMTKSIPIKDGLQVKEVNFLDFISAKVAQHVVGMLQQAQMQAGRRSKGGLIIPNAPN